MPLATTARSNTSVPGAIDAVAIHVHAERRQRGDALRVASRADAAHALHRGRVEDGQAGDACHEQAPAKSRDVTRAFGASETDSGRRRRARERLRRLGSLVQSGPTTRRHLRSRQRRGRRRQRQSHCGVPTNGGTSGRRRLSRGVGQLRRPERRRRAGVVKVEASQRAGRWTCRPTRRARSARRAIGRCGR